MSGRTAGKSGESRQAHRRRGWGQVGAQFNCAPPHQRVRLAHALAHLSTWHMAPIRRVYIPKAGTTEKRGLGIPVLADRACQALVKLALEPEWEAQFERNSSGFRPGRSAHEAIEAIFNAICLKPKYVLDADIEKCFDRIHHDALLKKLRTMPLIERLVRGWLKAGVLDGGRMLFPEAGTPQGGVISPLLPNIALHGFEWAMEGQGERYRILVIRYADDLVVLCEDLETIQAVKAQAEEWLAGMGLRFQESKTHITHTLDKYEGQTGFDFGLSRAAIPGRQISHAHLPRQARLQDPDYPGRERGETAHPESGRNCPPTSGRTADGADNGAQSGHPGVDELSPHLCRQAHLQQTGPGDARLYGLGGAPSPEPELPLALSALLAAARAADGVQRR